MPTPQISKAIRPNRRLGDSAHMSSNRPGAVEFTSIFFTAPTLFSSVGWMTTPQRLGRECAVLPIGCKPLPPLIRAALVPPTSGRAE